MLLFWCFWSLLRWAGSAFRQTLLFPELASKGPHVGRKREVELREWGGGCYLSWDQAELFKGPKRHYFYRARQGWVEFSEKQGFTPGISCPEFGRWMRLLQDSVEGKSTLALRKGKKKKKRTNELDLRYPVWEKRKEAGFTLSTEVGVPLGRRRQISAFSLEVWQKSEPGSPRIARLRQERFPGSGRSWATAP